MQPFQDMSHSLEHRSTDNQHATKGSEVFVGGLAHSVTEDKIREVFSTCGEIMDMRLIKDQKGNLKGFGFVRFATKDAADRAVKELSGSTLEGKKIGVLPSAAQDTLFLGNLNKGWTADDFDKVVRQVFPDVVSIDLAKPLSSSENALGKKLHNRGFAFVKFSSHAAAARAYRAGSRPEFVLGGNLHPSVEWAEEDAEIDPKELAKIKIAFIRNLPPTADESYLMKIFMPFGKVDRVVVSKKGQNSVGFIHFAQRSDLDKAMKELNEKTVQGPNGGTSFKLQVEVARPIDKKRKRAREDPQSKQPSEILSQSKLLKNELVADPYETAVLLLPVAVKERLLRILRLGIATRFDIDIQSLTSLKELPESTAISVLDQFMLSGADKHDKGAYLAGLISRVDKLGLHRLPLSSSRVGELVRKEPELSSFSGRVHLPMYDTLASHAGTTIARSDGYASRYSLYSDYPLSSRAAFGRVDETSPPRLQQIPSSSTPYSRVGPTSHLTGTYGKTEERSPLPLHQIPGSSTLYGKIGVDSHLPGASDRQPTRSQVRFDPYTGQPYKFDPFTGEPILPDNVPVPQRYRSPY